MYICMYVCIYIYIYIYIYQVLRACISAPGSGLYLAESSASLTVYSNLPRIQVLEQVHETLRLSIIQTISNVSRRFAIYVSIGIKGPTPDTKTARYVPAFP